jgi:tetratricopeptide (TPR) repeat protein
MVFSVYLVPSVWGQDEEAAALKTRAAALMEALKYTDALPLYEKLAILLPKDAEVYRNLGFSLIAQAANTDDQVTRKQIRIRARNMFISARDLGDDSLLVKGIIEGMPEDGSDPLGFSDNAEANKLMKQGEASFSSGKLEDALAAYQSALKLDPRCYYAALFSGDVYNSQEKWNEAEKWYHRAIDIDPFRETAYRYSATPLMKQGKYDQARDRYVEAYINAPYDKLAVSGIVQWAQVTKTPLGHPRLNIPETKVGADGKSNTTINVNPLADDGSMAWIGYSGAREEWKKDKFAKTFPKETVYRHTVAEEVDALRSVVSLARSFKAKTLSPDIALIEKMDKDGVLEAYVYMARPDQDIARDYLSYLRSNRDKLRSYVVNYVIGKK